MGVGDSRLEGDRLRCPSGHLNLSPPPSSGSRITFGGRDDNGGKAPILDFPMLHYHMSPCAAISPRHRPCPAA